MADRPFDVATRGSGRIRLTGRAGPVHVAALCTMGLMLHLPAVAHADDGAPRTVQLVTDAACQSKITVMLTQWETDRREEGWTVLKRIVSSEDPAALQTALRTIRPNHTFLVGDGVPFLTVTADPDGHGNRKIDADYKFVQDDAPTPFGSIGRTWFKNQGSAKAGSMELYRRYLAKRHTWDADRVRFGPMIAFDDHLSYRPDGAIWAKSVMNQARPERIEHLSLGAIETDGEITRRAKSPRLIEVVFSGGRSFAKPGGLYYFGDAAAWRNADPNNWGVGPRIGIFGAYGSFLCEQEWPDSLLTATLTTEHTVASFYDFQGIFPFGKLLSGSTIGDCGRLAAARGYYITNVFGDPTITIERAIQVTRQEP